ncbi:MAG TPA: cupin domain-containing protein [Methanothrix sp.]|nr:cupin domain-containing protein [Methanothrix sp.]
MIIYKTLSLGLYQPRCTSHSHPHDQAGYVVLGKIRITVDGKSCDLGPGDSYSAPSGILHSAIALEASVVVDTFSPPRDDYRAISG